jgi:hypothetical protein
MRSCELQLERRGGRRNEVPWREYQLRDLGYGGPRSRERVGTSCFLCAELVVAVVVAAAVEVESLVWLLRGIGLRCACYSAKWRIKRFLSCDIWNA